MAIKKIKKGPTSITVQATDDIVLTVTIGNAQAGGNVVDLDGQRLGKGRIENLHLGKGADIRGKNLVITTNVLDINPSSNRISITHFFLGGKPSVFSYPEKGDDPGVDNDGDIYSLTARYKFV